MPNLFLHEEMTRQSSETVWISEFSLLAVQRDILHSFSVHHMFFECNLPKELPIIIKCEETSKAVWEGNHDYYRRTSSCFHPLLPDLCYGSQFVCHTSCRSWLKVIKPYHSWESVKDFQWHCGARSSQMRPHLMTCKLLLWLANLWRHAGLSHPCFSNCLHIFESPPNLSSLGWLFQ